MADAAAGSSVRRLPPRLVALTPGTLQRSRAGATDAAIGALEQAAYAAFTSGLRGLVVREPALEDGAFLELGLRLRTRLDEVHGRDAATGGWLCLHDRLHLAAAVGANAVHLGGTSLGVTPARTVVGNALAIGLSSHAGDAAATFEGADYLFHAPVFEPTSKPSHGRATLGWDGLLDFAQACDLPVLGLGGITAQRLAELEASAGPLPVASLRGVALIGGLWGTSEEPIDGQSRALTDRALIARNTTELVAVCGRLFEGTRVPHAGETEVDHV